MLCGTGIAVVCTIQLLQVYRSRHLLLGRQPSHLQLPTQHCIPLLQVQSRILYHRLHVSLDAIQLSTSPCQGSLSPRETAVLSPGRCSARLDLHRAPGDALLPGAKALLQLDCVHVQLNPSSTAIVNQSLLQLLTAPATAEGAIQDGATTLSEGQQKV